MCDDFAWKTYFRRYPYTGSILVSNWKEYLADILSFKLDGEFKTSINLDRLKTLKRICVDLAYQKHGFVVSGQPSHLTDAYCNVVCFVLRPSFVCVLFFRRTLYSVKEVVDWFLLPLATTRLTMVNLIVISLLLIMAILWLHNCHTTSFRSWQPWSFTFCGCRMMGVYIIC